MKVEVVRFLLKLLRVMVIISISMCGLSVIIRLIMLWLGRVLVCSGLSWVSMVNSRLVVVEVVLLMNRMERMLKWVISILLVVVLIRVMSMLKILLILVMIFLEKFMLM